MGLYGKGEASLFAHKCKSDRVTHDTFKTVQELNTHTHYYLSDEPTHGLWSYNSSYQGS
jgi:hypothetical protein